MNFKINEPAKVGTHVCLMRKYLKSLAAYKNLFLQYCTKLIYPT